MRQESFRVEITNRSDQRGNFIRDSFQSFGLSSIAKCLTLEFGRRCSRSAEMTGYVSML